MRLNPAHKLAGVLEPVAAIRTDEDLGIGDTEGVRQMIDWCQRHRLGLFQTLPINETSGDHSPYNAISSLALEPATLAVSPDHLPDLTPEQFHALAPPARLAGLRRGPVDYAKVKALKRALLDAAFTSFLQHHFNAGTDRARQFRAFLAENADWLADYALFRVLMEENGNSPVWEQWPAEQRAVRPARTWLLSLPEDHRARLMRQQLFFMYVQWLAFSQWRALKDYATAKSVFLMGDIPFGVSRHSADVWANRTVFDLDWSGGAPPEKVFKVDAFTEKWGQNWGIPIYRWDVLHQRNFDWWRTRVGNLRKVFHLYRIDHVLGFFRLYSFPWTPDHNAEFLPLTEHEAAAKAGGRLPRFLPFADDTPEHQAANRQQGEQILHVVLEASGDTTVVAEDLGVVPDYVAPTLHELGIPGFRIPAFLRDHGGAYADPQTYPRLSLVQPATHDHPPLAAAWAEAWQNLDADCHPEASRRELRALMNFAGLKDEEPPREFTDRLHAGYLRAVLGSNSWLAVVLISDVFAQTDRFNTPGSAAPTNWTHRLSATVKQLDAEPKLAAKAKMFARLVQESSRAR